MTNAIQVPINKQSMPTRGLQSSPSLWTKEKSQKDAELWGNPQRFWVVQNNIYDLTPYISSHPGGSHWIALTKGQDITEHFITHHLNQNKARAVLQKYFVRQVSTKQRQRFTFQENGLYRKVKKRLLETYTPQRLQNSQQSTKIGTFFLILWAIAFALTGLYQSTLLAVLCGALIYPLAGVAHNFLHMKDHPFRFLWLLSGFTHKEWQQMHCLSHHSYANTLIDFQIQALEPVVYYLKVSPKNKPAIWICKQFLFLTATPFNILLKLVVIPLLKKTQPEWYYLIPLLQLPLLCFFIGSLWEAFKLFLIIHMTFSFIFFKLSFLGHRTGFQWTQGNQEIRDFAQHQIAASSDMTTDNCKGFWSYLLYAGFNFHAIHHMFPTIDNYQLPQASAILEEEASLIGVKLNKLKGILQGLFQIEKNFFKRKEWKKSQ